MALVLDTIVAEIRAIRHCSAGVNIWPWAGSEQGGEPDVVMACCGDVPTIETLAAVEIIRTLLPELRVRVINVVDRVPGPSARAGHAQQAMRDKRSEHKRYISE